jgi:hypothetical protein
MVTRHDIWEFGWSHTYEERKGFIQSLDVEDRAWVRAEFIQLDNKFAKLVQSKTNDMYSIDTGDYVDRVEAIRAWARDEIEPEKEEEKE